MYPLWAMTMGGAVVAAPTLSSVATSGGAVGDIDGAYPATLTGTNFTGATGVTFGGTAATSVVVVNATTITCVVPAHATGAVSVVVTNPGGSNGANTLFRYFSPAELTSCTSWQRAAFTTAPWAATASAGTSGTTGNFINGVTPSAGTAVNGRTPATFNGTTQYLVNANTLPSFVNGSTSSIVSLFKPAAAKTAAVAGSEYLDPTLWGDYTNGGLGLSYSSLGFGGFFFSAGTFNPIRKASAVGTWASAFFTWDSTNLNLTVNGSAATPVACGAFGASTANSVAIGSSYANTGMLQGDSLESLTFNVKLTAQNILDIRSYFNTRHFPAGATV